MKKINADCILDFVAAVIIVFYIEYDIGLDLIKIYNIEDTVLTSFLITLILSIFIVYYIIKKTTFSGIIRFNFVKNLKDYLFRILIGFSVVLWFFISYGMFYMHFIIRMDQPVTLLIMFLYMLILIAMLRFYYLKSINNNKFHFCLSLFIVVVLYLIIISSILIVSNF